MNRELILVQWFNLLFNLNEFDLNLLLSDGPHRRNLTHFVVGLRLVTTVLSFKEKLLAQIRIHLALGA